VEEDGVESRDQVTVKILAGASHAFLQMLSLYPESHSAVRWCASWIHEAFDHHHYGPVSRIATDSTPSPAAADHPGNNHATTTMLSSWVDAQLVPEKKIMRRRRQDFASDA